MKFYELVVTVFLRTSIPFDKAQEMIGRNLNQAMLYDPVLKEKHEGKGFKNYVFNNFYPVEQDKEYKKGKVYIFNVRSIDGVFANKLQRCLVTFKSNDFQVVAVQLKTKKQTFIKELYTLTPAIATVNGRYWEEENGLDVLIERIQENTKKKYEAYFKEELNPHQRFFKGVVIKNKKAIHYKNGLLKGHKLKLYINEDEISQKLAFFALATGLLEKGSAVGAGFCFAD